MLLAFVLRRLAWTVVVLFVVVTLLFLLMRSIGGNPFRHGPLLGFTSSTGQGWVKYGDFQPQAIQDNQRRLYGLDRPWWRQYLDYVRNVATLDFGPSLSYRYRTVNEIIEEHGPESLELAALAVGWSLLLGLPLGVVGALRARRPEDYLATAVSLTGYALPSFLVATLLVYLFSIRLHWLPPSGWQESWRAKLLPSFTLGLLPTAYVARLVRAGMLETLSEDYVRTAQAKGLRRRRVMTVHVLRNSLFPVLTAGGPLVGTLVTGVFVIEEVFSIPGLGRYYVAAVSARDYPLVLGLTIVLSAAVILANLAVDLLYGVLDPRTREARA